MTATYNSIAEYNANRNEYIANGNSGNDPVFDAAFNAAFDAVLGYSAGDFRCLADFDGNEATPVIAYAVANVAVGIANPLTGGYDKGDPIDAVKATYRYRNLYTGETDWYTGLAVAAASVIANEYGDEPELATETAKDGTCYADRVVWHLARLNKDGLGFPLFADGNDSVWHTRELLWGYYQKV